MDSFALLELVESKRRSRDLIGARALIREHRDEQFDSDVRRQLLCSEAAICREFGEWDRAAECHARAAAISDPGSWLEAESLIDKYWEAGSKSSSGRRAQLRSELSDGARQKATSLGLAGMYWASAVISAGPHPDDAPASADLEKAAAALARAEEKAGEEDRVRLAGLRLKWVVARDAGEDRLARAEEAMEATEQCRAALADRTADDDAMRAGIGYREGRLRLLKRDHVGARATFESVIADFDPGHQASNVWRIYCERVLGDRPLELLAPIDALLPLEFRRLEAETDQDQPIVVAPHLVAELLTERGAILEDIDPAGADVQYRLALEFRPAMPFAQRARLRCLARLNRLEEASRLGDDLVGEAGKEHARYGTQLPAALLVDLGLIDVKRERVGQGLELFRQAAEASPQYAFAHDALVTTCHQEDRLVEAIEHGQEVLSRDYAGGTGWNGVHVALGYAYLKADRREEALAEFRRASEDTAPSVKDRAWAGLITAHRTNGCLRDALEAAAQLTEGPGRHVLEAAGWVHAELGDYGQAVNCFNLALDKDPQSRTVLSSLARTYRLLGRGEEAWRLLEAGRRELPDQIARELESDLGWTALDQGELDTATEHFQNALDVRPKMEAAHRGLIVAAAQAGRSKLDIEQFAAKARASRNGETGGVLTEVGIAHLSRNELIDAVECFRHAEKIESSESVAQSLRVHQADALISARAFDDAANTITKLIDGPTSTAQDPRGSLAEARLHLATGELHGALSRYLQVLNAWPWNALARLGAASACYRLDDCEGALHHVDSALENCAMNVRARELRAAVLVRRHELKHPIEARDSEDLQLATSECQLIRELEPRRPAALECLAEIARSRGQVRLAETYLCEAGRHTPSTADAQRSRAVLYLRSARADDAIKCLEQAIGEEHNDPTLQLLIGLAYLERGSNPNAIASLRLATELEPSESFAYTPLATALENDGHTDEAIDVLTRGLVHTPSRNRVALLLTRARVRFADAKHKEGREAVSLLTEALADVEQASARLPSDGSPNASADIEYHRAVILHQMGKRREARKALRSCLAIDPQHTEANRVLVLIDEDPHTDPSDRHTRSWSLALGVLAVTLLVLAIVMTWIKADWKPSAFHWSPLTEIIGALLIVLVIAATLPRLVRLDVGRQVRLDLQATTPVVENTQVSLAFRRLPAMSGYHMAGPTPYGFSDLPDDRFGAP